MTNEKISKIQLPDGTDHAIRSSLIPYGEVDSTSTSTAYTATIEGISELTDGTIVMLHNGVVTSAAGFTININNLGAKKCYNNLTNATQDTTIFNVAYTMLFVYASSLDEGNGGFWCYRGYDANTNTIGYQVRTNSQSLPMKVITYRYRLLFTSADHQHFVPANTSSSTNATAKRDVCQEKIDPFGAIFMYGASASVAKDATPSAAVLWQQYTLNLGYSFNRTGAALTLTPWKPVFVKCNPQSDGSAIIDASTPYTQELPSTADGKIYIFLGIAYSATNIELQIDHPVYWHDGTGIRLWTGKEPQDKLVSGTNIKTINNTSLLGSGNIDIGGGGGGGSDADITLSSGTVQLAGMMAGSIHNFMNIASADFQSSFERWADINADGGTIYDLVDAIVATWADLLPFLGGYQ